MDDHFGKPAEPEKRFAVLLKRLTATQDEAGPRRGDA